MTADKETVAVYDLKAGDYVKAFTTSEIPPALLRFIDSVPAGSHVLDLGCGPGTHAAMMHAQGLRVTATDASSSMVKLAQKHPDIDVRQAEFGDLSDENIYDGVWANFSLLHAPRDAFVSHLKSIATALKINGIFHLGLKTGTGEKRDHLGRQYTFYTADELRDYLHQAGFDIIDETTGKSAGLAGTVDPWIEILARLRA